MIIVFDVDNTLYDFAAFFAPFFRSATHIAAQEAGIAEDIIFEEFRDVFRSVGSLEYQFLIQRSPSLNTLSAEKIERILHVMSVAGRQIRKKRLKLYPGVRETLDQLRGAGVICAAITNAPFYQVDQRFRALGLHKYFDALLCAENLHTLDGEPYQKYERRRHEISKSYRKFVELPPDRQKPSDYGYRIIRELYDISDDFVAIGDSVLKDLAPAANIGFRTIWAKYGTNIEKGDLDTLLRVTPWDAEQIARSYSDNFSPDWAIDRFDEIIDILKIPYQPSLF